MWPVMTQLCIKLSPEHYPLSFDIGGLTRLGEDLLIPMIVCDLLTWLDLSVYLYLYSLFFFLFLYTKIYVYLSLMQEKFCKLPISLEKFLIDATSGRRPKFEL